MRSRICRLSHAPLLLVLRIIELIAVIFDTIQPELSYGILSRIPLAFGADKLYEQTLPLSISSFTWVAMNKKSDPDDNAFPSMQNRNALLNDYNNSSLHNQHFRRLHVYNATLHVQANELKCWLTLWVFSLRLLASSYYNGLLE